MDGVRSILFMPLSSTKRFIAYVVLIALAFFGNEYALNLHFGVQLFFGSIFMLISAVFFGPVWGTAASIALYFLCRHFGIYPQGTLILHVAESVFIGICAFRRPKKMTLWDVVFWILIGTPAGVLLYRHFVHHFGIGTNIFVMTNLANGFFNLLIADLLLTYLPWHTLLAQPEQRTINFSRILFHLSMMAVIGPFLIFMWLNGMYIKQSVSENVIGMLEAKADHTKEDLASWDTADKRLFKLHNAIQIGYLNDVLKKNAANEANITITDEQGEVLSSFEPLKDSQGNGSWRRNGSWRVMGESLYVWLPKAADYHYAIQYWGDGWLLIVQDIPDLSIKAVVSVPMQNYQAEVFKQYLNHYRSMFIFLVFAGLLSHLVNSLLVRSMRRLAEATTGLPHKLKRSQVIDWPKSRIFEIASLIFNFRFMSDNLMEMFAETQQINEKLHNRTIQLQKSQERLHQLAYYDVLTELPNRLFFSNDLQQSLEEAGRYNERVAVLFFDLNEFKKVNDTMGHAAGDDLLKIISQKLLPYVDETTRIFRLGGDEFVMVLKNCDTQQIELTASRILHEFDPMIPLQGQEVFITTSIGISVFPDDGTDMETIVKNADTAMYAAKDKGGNTYQFYDPSMNAIVSERMMMENSLRKALELEQFELYYQPKFDSFDGSLTGMEALLRWEHPERGFIPPAAFIPMAEATGMINPIGEWVIRTACMQNKAWHDAGYADLQIAVNLSARQLYEPNLADKIKTILKETKLSPKYLQLEITEGFFIHDVDQVIEVTRRLHRMGVGISIDDFGTGYSSLSQLKHLPIRELKIDRSFIRNVHRDRYNAAIVKAVIEVAHSVKLKVVAEGIETEQERDFLIQHLCDEMQGYLFSRPVPKEQFERLLAEARSGSDAKVESQENGPEFGRKTV